MSEYYDSIEGMHKEREKEQDKIDAHRKWCEKNRAMLREKKEERDEL